MANKLTVPNNIPGQLEMLKAAKNGDRDAQQAILSLSPESWLRIRLTNECKGL